jgi:diguanylate cyclase (GGDEF)-like protein
MDDKGTTHVCNSLRQLDFASQVDSALPMYLIVVNGGIPGAMYRVSGGGTQLGRGAENTYSLQESCISRNHAYVRADSKSDAWLTDLGSTNGTFVNGQRLSANIPISLKDGDRIQLGSVLVLKFARLSASEERFQREMFERTVRDALTGLYNRAYFLNQVGPLTEGMSMRGLGMAILMLDIDHFKRINDTYGHDVGDHVLREVASVLRESTRSDDLVARYGGEEFVLALPVRDPDLATERAERIRTNLSTRLISAGGDALCVTASVGLAYAPPEQPRPAAELITAADRCLYRAKRSGRDRLVFRNEQGRGLGDGVGDAPDSDPSLKAESGRREPAGGL